MTGILYRVDSMRTEPCEHERALTVALALSGLLPGRINGSTIEWCIDCGGLRQTTGNRMGPWFVPREVGALELFELMKSQVGK